MRLKRGNQMSSGILTINTPMDTNWEQTGAPFETLEGDLDGDGEPERVEVEVEPRLQGSPFREWRVYKGVDPTPVLSAAGVEISINRAEDGSQVLVSDQSYWRIAQNGKMYPYGDLVMSRSELAVLGTKEDRDLLDLYGATGMFQDNVRTILVQLGESRARHRVIFGGGQAFADQEDGTAPFVVTDAGFKPLIIGRSMSHPWLFHNRSGFTMITESLYGFQISLVPEGVL